MVTGKGDGGDRVPSAPAGASDEALMALALELAARGRGSTSPNPMVGAVLWNAGRIVGRGHHVRAGAPHAEVVAIEEAGPLARGATLYCTLEPCCHTGRTPPCADRIVEAGVRRVVVGVRDPDPRVDGGGIRRLRDHGIEVVVGVAAERAARLNEAFFTVKRRGRPFVTLKAAASLDGRIAAAPGRRTGLSGPRSQEHAHEVRAVVDAVAVGSGTVLVDDPLLTARGPARRRPFVRVIFDTRMRTPPAARVLTTLGQGPVVVVTTDAAAAARPARAAALEAAGATLERLPARDPRRRGGPPRRPRRERPADRGRRRAPPRGVEGGHRRSRPPLPVSGDPGAGGSPVDGGCTFLPRRARPGPDPVPGRGRPVGGRCSTV